MYMIASTPMSLYAFCAIASMSRLCCPTYSMRLLACLAYASRVDCTLSPQPFFSKPVRHGRSWNLRCPHRGAVGWRCQCRSSPRTSADAPSIAQSAGSGLCRGSLPGHAVAPRSGAPAAACAAAAARLQTQAPRGVACRALALCISEANAAAVAEVASLRRAALDAHALVLVGDCGLAEQGLANALRFQPTLVPHPRPLTRCSMCDRQVRYVYILPATEDRPARFRRLCDRCNAMQPNPLMQL